MNERQHQLFTLAVKQYIRTAEPVGSKFLVAEGGLDWSEATVRNDLRALEEEGFLTHPHTSAGRIPTSRGYRQYLDDTDWSGEKLQRSDAERLQSAAGSQPENRTRQLAKTLAEITSQLVLVTSSLSSFYYTGLSGLFAQPEFRDVEEITNFSRLFDQFERSVALFQGHFGAEPRCFVGGEHPFGDRMGVVAIGTGARAEELLALLGPERMDYAFCVPLVRKAAELMHA